VQEIPKEWIVRFASFKAEIEQARADFKDAIGHTTSIAQMLNGLTAFHLAMADAVGKIAGDDARSEIEREIPKILASQIDQFEPCTKKFRQEMLDALRLKIVEWAYQNRITASVFFDDEGMPSRPGMDSAYSVAGQICQKEPKLGRALPAMSAEAVERLRFRTARRLKQAPEGVDPFRPGDPHLL
jgi:hypothetical protein